MQGMILLAALLMLFITLGLIVEEVTTPMRILMTVAIVVVTGWYLVF
jgi:hypothetical protein